MHSKMPEVRLPTESYLNPDPIDGHAVLQESTTKQRTLALLAYAETNNVEAAAVASRTSPARVREWISEPQAKAELQAARDALKAGLIWKYQEVQISSVNKLLERIENGDPYVLKNGEVIAVPLKARDLASIAAIAGERHAILTGAIDQGGHDAESLMGLANKVLDIAQSALSARHGTEGAKQRIIEAAQREQAQEAKRQTKALNQAIE